MVAACRDPGAAEQLRTTGAAVVALDVSSDASLAGLAARVRTHVETLDLVVNNAGIKEAAGLAWSRSAGPLHELQRGAMMAVLETNAVGPVLVAQHLVPVLRRPGGVIVNVSSLLGSLQGNVGMDYAYNCSKAALNMATVQLDRELGPDGIVTVSLNPGWIRTDMGGVDAPLEPEQTTREIADLLVRLGPDHAGRFLDRFGDPTPW